MGWSIQHCFSAGILMLFQYWISLAFMAAQFWRGVLMAMFDTELRVTGVDMCTALM